MLVQRGGVNREWKLFKEGVNRRNNYGNCSVGPHSLDAL